MKIYVNVSNQMLYRRRGMEEIEGQGPQPMRMQSTIHFQKNIYKVAYKKLTMKG